MDKVDQIKKLISIDEIKDALNETLNLFSNDKSLHNEIILLLGRWNSIKREERLGIIPYQQSSEIKSSIKNSLSENLERYLERKEVYMEIKNEDLQIFFSYAWGDDKEEGESREQIVNDLYYSLNKNGFNIVRDKVDLGYKGLISDFMKKIGKSERVIIVLTEKYVKSPYCMFELYEVARNCKFDKGLFRDTVVPIKYEFIDFTKPSIIMSYLKYWKEQQDEWEELVKLMPDRLSKEQFDRYDKIKLVGSNIGKLMDWLADMNTLTKKLLSENDFEEIKKALK